MGKSFMVAFCKAQADQIKQHAVATGRSSSSVVREAIDQYFSRTKMGLDPRMTIVIDVANAPINTAMIKDGSIDMRMKGER